MKADRLPEDHGATNEDSMPALVRVPGEFEYKFQPPQFCKCGGEIEVRDWDDDATEEFRYEAYCTRCGDCDPNGWPTLKAVVQNSPQFFGGNARTEARS